MGRDREWVDRWSLAKLSKMTILPSCPMICFRAVKMKENIIIFYFKNKKKEWKANQIKALKFGWQHGDGANQFLYQKARDVASIDWKVIEFETFLYRLLLQTLNATKLSVIFRFMQKIKCSKVECYFQVYATPRKGNLCEEICVVVQALA